MGDVSLVIRKDGGFERLYAMKRLLGVFERDPDVRSMFEDEARIAGLIRHPNVVSVVDVGSDNAGSFLVMDYIEGVSLAQLITNVRENGEEMPLQVALKLLRDAADGLHAAHELRNHDGASLNLVHRDVSPQNVLVGLDGIARMTDFGIAKALGKQTKTSTGVIKGKSGYFAPEQLRFEKVDRRADLFALGVILYETLTLRRLYRDESMEETAGRILREPPPDVGMLREDVPDAVVELGFELLAKMPHERPETAKQVAERLDDALAELRLIEGSVDIPAFLERALDVHTIRQRRKVADQGRRNPNAFPTVAQVVLGETPKAPNRQRLVLMAVATFALAAVGGSLGVYLTQPGAEPPSVAAAAEPAPERPVEPPAAAMVEPSPSANEGETPVQVGAMESAPRPSARARRRAQARRRAAMRSRPAAEPEPTMTTQEVWITP